MYCFVFSNPKWWELGLSLAAALVISFKANCVIMLAVLASSVSGSGQPAQTSSKLKAGKKYILKKINQFNCNNLTCYLYYNCNLWDAFGHDGTERGQYDIVDWCLDPLLDTISCHRVH